MPHHRGMPKINPHPNSLANLKPNDSAAGRVQGLTHGFGAPFSKHRQCTKIKRDGTRCKGIAVNGMNMCNKHVKYPATHPKAMTRPWRYYQGAYEELRAMGAPPLELARQAAWIGVEGCRASVKVPRQLALFKAWQEGTETGNWQRWRDLVSVPVEDYIADAKRRNKRLGK